MNKHLSSKDRGSSSNTANPAQEDFDIVILSDDELRDSDAQEINESALREITPEQCSALKKIAETVVESSPFKVFGGVTESLVGVSQWGAAMSPIYGIAGRRLPFLFLPFGVFGLCKGGVDYLDKLAYGSPCFQKVPVDQAQKILRTIYDGAEDFGMTYQFLESLTHFILEMILKGDSDKAHGLLFSSAPLKIFLCSGAALFATFAICQHFQNYTQEGQEKTSRQRSCCEKLKNAVLKFIHTGASAAVITNTLHGNLSLISANVANPITISVGLVGFFHELMRDNLPKTANSICDWSLEALRDAVLALFLWESCNNIYADIYDMKEHKKDYVDNTYAAAMGIGCCVMLLFLIVKMFFKKLAPVKSQAKELPFFKPAAETDPLLGETHTTDHGSINTTGDGHVNSSNAGSFDGILVLGDESDSEEGKKPNAVELKLIERYIDTVDEDHHEHKLSQ